MSSIDSIDALLASFPDVLDADHLAALTGFNRNSIYIRSSRAKKGKRNLLPLVFTIPGSPALLFLKSEVRAWLIEAQEKQQVRRGRPIGSKSRRGAGRADLEAKVAGEGGV